VELFGEAAGRVVVTVPAGNVEKLLAMCEAKSVPAHRLGATSSGDGLSIETTSGTIDLKRAELEQAYESYDSIFPNQLATAPGH
jgi:hypothetical protein